MTGLEPMVIGYLTAWAVQKARRVGQHADGTVDRALDAVMERLESAVLAKVGDQSAVAELESQAAHGQTDDRTIQRAEREIGVAADRDGAFDAELRSLIEEIRALSRTPGLQQVAVHATASGQAKMPVHGSGTQNNSFA